MKGEKKMKSLKKLVGMTLALTFLIGCCSTLSSAAEIQPLASDYFYMYYATCNVSSSGMVTVNAVAKTSAGKSMTQLGIKTVKVQESANNRTWTTVETITSSDNPSFISSGSNFDKTFFVYSGNTDCHYRCVVTFYAKDASGSDTKSYTSNSAQA